MCIQYLLNNPRRIGGRDVIVEIDETCVSRGMNVDVLLGVEYERGRLVRHQQWIFGGVVRGTFGQECFLVEVARRDAATILQNIQQFIEPESIIFSDLWKGYDRITNMPEGYQHIRVNHSENFVNLNNPTAHTQSKV